MDVMKKISFLLLSLFFCLKATHALETGLGDSTKEMLPWVANPTADTLDYLYGIGEGNSLAKAEQSALSNISGKLATVVSSNISSETTLDNGRVNAYFNERVKSKTFDTKLSGYELVQSALHNKQYYAMIRMSRSIFVKDTLGRLTLIDDSLNNRVTLASKVSKMQHYLALNEIKPDIDQATELTLLLQAASATFQSDQYLHKYQKHRSQLNEMLYLLRFKVEASSDLSSVAEIISRLLEKQKLSTSAPKKGHADAVITLTGGAEKSFIFSEYTTQLRIKIQVKDQAKRIINTEEFVVAGGSMTNFEASMRTASRILETELENKGLLTILGMKKSSTRE
jgi:hypothetical protein